MLEAKITSKMIRNHFDYFGWLYFLLPIAMILFWSMIYAFTEYRPPDDKILSFYAVGHIQDTLAIEGLASEVALEFPGMEQFDFQSISLQDVNDVASWQKFTTLIYAGQGDVYLIDAEIFPDLCLEGAFLPLDDLIDTDIDLSSVRSTSNENPVPRIYGIPADSLYDLFNKEGYDVRRSVLVVMAFSTNPSESVQLIQWLLENRQGEPPDGMEQWPEKAPMYPEVSSDPLASIF